MNKPKLVGITGGIGSGKSTVCKILEAMGLKTYYADDQAKLLMEKDPLLIKEIKALFGRDAYEKGKLNRKLIAGQAFNNGGLLRQLNQAVHPAVDRDFTSWVQQNSQEEILLKEAALLFETGSYKELDCTILVTANESTRIKRVVERDPHKNEKGVKEIMGKQFPDEQKLALTNFVIDNNGNQPVIKQVVEVYQKIC